MENTLDNVFNFSAGPAALPKPVMKQAQADFIDWNGLGTSVMEISHRSKKNLFKSRMSRSKTYVIF